MKYHKILIIVLLGILIAVCFSRCNKSHNNFKPGNEKSEYKGTSSVTIKYYEYNAVSGQDVFIEEKQYSFDVFVFVNPPLESDGTTESNPFNLQISPDREVSNDEEGHIDISSALNIAVTTGYALLQYWDLTLNGEQVEGTLQDNHTAEASAANLIWAWEDVAGIVMTMPFAIANGATLSGSVTSKSVSLSIAGQSVDTYRQFQCLISASAD
jgi:hypothetical protein